MLLPMLRKTPTAGQEEVLDVEDDIGNSRNDALLIEPVVAADMGDFSRFRLAPLTVSLAEESSRNDQTMIEARRIQAAVEQRRATQSCTILLISMSLTHHLPKVRRVLLPMLRKTSTAGQELQT